MPQDQLERTEFFNDFLMKDGLHHGINLYAYDSDQNIGDLRIWRVQHRPAFGKHEALLLDNVLPYFRNALRNARIMARAHGIEGFWRQLLENMHVALFLFDADGSLLYENSEAREMEGCLSDVRGSFFLLRLHSFCSEREPIGDGVGSFFSVNSENCFTSGFTTGYRRYGTQVKA